MKRDFTLLKYHMDCDPDYIMCHAAVAGQLSAGAFTTYGEYATYCKSMGVNYYSEALFDRFMGIIPQPVVA